METESLGRALRRRILRGISEEKERISDFSLLGAARNAILSGLLPFFLFLGVFLLCAFSTVWVLLKKRRFLQKDTLCVFVYMIGTLFLLESIQQILRLRVSPDVLHGDIELELPKSAVYISQGSKETWCESGIEKCLEEKTEELEMGSRAANAYRRLIRQKRIQRRARQDAGAFVVDKGTGLVIAETAPSGKTTLLAPVPTQPQNPKKKRQKEEYCIFSGNRKNRGTCVAGCVFLSPPEYLEARAELIYVNKVNQAYSGLQMKLRGEREKYNKVSLQLLQSLKKFLKTSSFISTELSDVGISLTDLENRTVSLVEKYNKVFEYDARAPRTEITDGGNSICVLVDRGTAYRTVKPLRIRRDLAASNMPSSEPSVVVPEEILEEQKVTVTDTKTYTSVLPQEHPHMEAGNFKSPAGKSRGPESFLLRAGSPLLLSSGLQPDVDTEEAANRKGTKQARKSTRSASPFLSSVHVVLLVAEVWMFVQVGLVLVVVMAAIFDRRKIHSVFFSLICASLCFVLALSIFSFVIAVGFSSMCRAGLGCSARMETPAQRLQSPADLIDLPERVLREAVSNSGRSLQRHINALLTLSATDEAEKVLAQLQRLVDIRGDFDLLITGNLHKPVINKKAIYEHATDIISSIKRIKALDRNLRQSRLLHTFKELAEIEALMSSKKGASRKKRESLAALAGISIPPDTSTCKGKEAVICRLRQHFDALFVGLFLLPVGLSLLIAI